MLFCVVLIAFCLCHAFGVRDYSPWVRGSEMARPIKGDPVHLGCNGLPDQCVGPSSTPQNQKDGPLSSIERQAEEDQDLLSILLAFILFLVIFGPLLALPFLAPPCGWMISLQVSLTCSSCCLLLWISLFVTFHMISCIFYPEDCINICLSCINYYWKTIKCSPVTSQPLTYVNYS